jgi:signal transduction histidine kinase
MSFIKKHKLAVITAGYWVLLLYIVIALLWWFIALNNQNNILTELRMQDLKKDDLQYVSNKEKITEAQKIKIAQYIGEGSIFLMLIVIGAVFVYRATRRQLMLAHQQQNFMMAVTHELKTPIAITRLNLETLLKRKLEVEKQEKLINNTIDETDRLNTLCNNILFAAQLDGGIYRSAKQKINLSKLVETCAHNFKTRFAKRTFEVLIKEDIYLEGEELLLQMMVNNLIDNALKYSPEQAMVKIELAAINNKIELRIADGGIGILDKEKKKVFEKFYRVGDENTRKTKGSGLGLFLSKKIMQDHNGKIFIKDNQPAGSIFTAIFPI